MGRRILPKLDPAIDYRRHLDELDELQEPLALREWFAAAQPLELEVGCGKGLFLSHQSGLHPDRNYIGIEIAKKYARFSAYRMAKLARDNAHIIRGDALAFLRDWLPDESLSAIHVYYPDPWWKARHRKRRVVSPEFSALAHARITTGGKVHFWTDVEEYFSEGCAAIQEAANWLKLEAEVAGDDALPDGITHFDRRMIRNQHDVFRAVFQKTV